MTSRFGGRTAIITGASRGIGLAIAQRLVSEGARVCITARRPDPLKEAVEALGGPEHAIGVPGRGDDPEHQDEAIAASAARIAAASPGLTRPTKCCRAATRAAGSVVSCRASSISSAVSCSRVEVGAY